MTVQNPPIYLQSGSHPAEDVRRFHGALVNDTAGILNSGDLLVSANGTPNMSVNVAGGRAFIVGTEATYQGTYAVENRGVTNVVIGASDPTNSRYDIVVARIRDSAYSGVTNAWSLEVIAGTPSGSPAEPAIPANCLSLCRVLVPAAATTITGANLLDRRARSHQNTGIIVCTSTTRPSAPSEGMVIFETNTDRTLIYNGSLWIGIGATSVPPPLFYTGTVSGGTATTDAYFITQNSILTAPYPLTMIVEVSGEAGGNSAANNVMLGIRDEAGTSILASAPVINVNAWTQSLSATGNTSHIHMIGKKDYTLGQTCGFRVAYRLNTSNVTIGAVAKVSFIPKVS